ncbi:LYS14 Lysine biosynthesis regulatory protein LYS14 [Candida maltosa Xu316]
MKSESSTTAGSMNGNSPQTPQTSTSNHGLSASPHPLDDGMLGLYDHTDLELLTTDLNNMVTKIMFDMNYDDSKRKVPETDESSIKSCESTTKLDNHYSYNLPISVISMKNQANKTYLEAFYNEFSGIILPFPAYDKAHDCYFNPARDIILKSASNQKYILAAVLANGARLRFNKTQNEDDEEAYCLYLSKCLKLLGPAIAEDDKKLTSNIENVLLTVLLLTVGNASNLKQDWRPHLKGAKDLLLKASVNNRKPSKIFIFCKIWFVTIEILASFSSHKGGTLQTDQEIDDLINSGDEYEQQVLKELGIVFDNGFNIMGGYHHDCYNLFGKLMKVLNRTRNGTFNPQDSKEYLKLFADFQRVTEIQFINKEGIFPGLENEKINPITISWMDVSHQTFTQACMMTILEKCFGETYSSPQIQVLTNSIIQSIAYLSQYSADEEPEYKTPHALMMLQWSVSIAAKNLINENHKDAVSKFFQISAKVGSGGATIALKRIIRIWDKRDGKPVSEDENDSEDLVSY